MARYSEKRAREIAWGRGGRPTSKVIRETVERRREEARQRAQKRIDERKAITKARHEREDLVRRTRQRQPPAYVDPKGWRQVTPYGEPLTPEERAKEAQATIREAQAVEAQAEAARIDERENWVSEFTPQQRHEISVFETAKGRVRADIGVGLNEVQGTQMIQALDRKIGSYQKVRRPRSKEDGPIYPEGQEIGKTWSDPNGSGALMGRNEKGEEIVRVKPGETLEGIQLKEQMAIAATQRKRFQKWEDEREKFARDLMSDKISIPQEQPMVGRKVPDVERYRSPGEVQSELVRVFGAAPSWAQAEIQQQRQPIQAEPDEILHAREVIKAPGMGLENVEAAERLIAEWESREGGTTEAEFRRMPSGTRFIDPKGRERIKP